MAAIFVVLDRVRKSVGKKARIWRLHWHTGPPLQTFLSVDQFVSIIVKVLLILFSYSLISSPVSCRPKGANQQCEQFNQSRQV